MSARDQNTVAGPIVSRRTATLCLLVIVGFGIRLWYSGALSAHPEWSDPDGYIDMAHALVRGPRGWHWSSRAVQFAEFTKAPLYQVFLSFFERFSSVVPFPQSALAAHACLNALTPIALYMTGRRLHNERCGLIAAAVYTFWIPNILTTAAFWQEQLFIPALAAAMALTAVAGERGGVRRWAIAGAGFAVAALTRSSVIYFIVPAAVLLVCAAQAPRRQAAVHAAAMVGGFLALTLPYVVYISGVTGRLTFIESVGFYSLKHFSHVSPSQPQVNLLTMMADPSGPPTSVEVLRFLWADVSGSPAAFALKRLDYVRLLLKPGGGSLLASTFASGPIAASALKVAVHGALDLPFVLVLVLAPWGVAVARQRGLALFLAMWPPVYLLLVSTMLWAGTRYRAPIEPVLITLAAAVIAGGWRRPGAAAMTAAAVVSAILLSLVAASAASVLGARANYGTARWPTDDGVVTAPGSLGMYVTCSTPVLTFTVEPLAGNANGPVTVDLRLDGRSADRLTLGDGPKTVRYALDAPKRLYLEVRGVDGHGRPAALRLRIE